VGRINVLKAPGPAAGPGEVYLRAGPSGIAEPNLVTECTSGNRPVGTGALGDGWIMSPAKPPPWNRASQDYPIQSQDSVPCALP
jgi:hypothetical protein